jgi:serine/threonine protein phosphatase 1
MRKFVIGDIHGGAKALHQVLEKANFDFENDQLIAVGDVCDGWPETAEAIETLLKIKNLIFCRGNHDDWTIRFLPGSSYNILAMDYHAWKAHGGSATVDSYEKNPDLKEKHLEWLKKSVVYHIDESNRLYLHAGFDTNYDIDNQPRDRSYDSSDGVPTIYFWDRYFWSNVSRGFIDPVCDSFTEIYIGHTPTISNWKHGRPVRFGNVTNMDTGAAFVGKLSLMNVETKELFQSDPVFQLYPEHKGRNGSLLAQDPNWNKWDLFKEEE